MVERLNVALSDQSAKVLVALQKRTGMKKVDLVNRALTVYDFIDSELKSGHTLIIRDQEGNEQILKIF